MVKKEAFISFVAICVLFAVISASIVLGQVPPAKPVAEAKCFDTGAFSLSNIEDRGRSVTIKKSGGSAAAVSGTWREMSNGLFRFASDDMAVTDVKGGYYTVAVDGLSYGVTCPPFKFSCKLINITINSCYRRNDTFFGKYTAYSLRYDKKNEFRFEKPFMLTYAAIADVAGKRKEMVHSPVAVSPEFEAINLSRVRRVGSNTYTLRWNTPLNVSKFIVRYDDCETAKYKFYDSFECSQRPSCSQDSECLLNERCEDGFCIPISCAACQFVSNHTCVDYDCCGDADCDLGFACMDQSCQQVACGFSEYVSGHGCESLECAEDEYVSNHTCSKLNCKEDEVAVNHICKPVECADNEAIANRSCQKLKCGFLKSANNHACVSVFSLLFRK